MSVACILTNFYDFDVIEFVFMKEIMFDMRNEIIHVLIRIEQSFDPIGMEETPGLCLLSQGNPRML